MFFIKSWIKSLRTRYLFVTMLSLCFVIILIILVNQYITETNQALFDGIERRLPVSLIKQDLRHNVKLASRDLDLYLFEPAIIHQTRFDQHIASAAANINALANNDWVNQNQLKETIDKLAVKLNYLNENATDLMMLRLDANLMYPVLRQANGTMIDANEKIATALTRAIDEQRREKETSPELMSLLVDTRDIWRRTVSSYRLYIINRMGKLFISALNAQERGIEDIFQVVVGKIILLEDVIQKNATGLETIESLALLQEQVPRWKTGFEKIIHIQTTNEWRADVDIVINKVYPLQDDIYTQLNMMNEKLYQSSVGDVKFQQQSKNNLSYALWMLAVFLFFLIVSVYVFLDRALLKPIALISESLRTNTESNLAQLLPEVKSEEIGEFINAFDHTQKQVKSRQAELVYIATHDVLTLLPNRGLLAEKIEDLIELASQEDASFALMILDLDRFKEVNDTLGHLIGDRLLCNVANRLKVLVQKPDFVARLGGDEFAIIIPNIKTNQTGTIAKNICDGLEEVYSIDDYNLYLGVSLGIAIYPQHGNAGVTLMKNADIAMYNAKNSNISFDIYDATISEHNVHKLSLLSELRMAIVKDQLFIELQPIYASHNNQVLGFEALLRWDHPTLSTIYPDAFIQMAEQTGLIRNITSWVIDKALKACKSWQPHAKDIYVSVNVTAWDLHENIVNVIDDLLNKYQLLPRHLILELTERSVMTESTKVEHTLEKLSHMGVRFAMDDFGTGFSSMTYLQKLPIKLLKIDRSFVMYMTEEKSDASIVRSIIDLAHNLDLNVIAEGVETQETYQKLVGLNCDALQGNYLSWPVDEKAAILLIQKTENKKIVDVSLV